MINSNLVRVARIAFVAGFMAILSTIANAQTQQTDWRKDLDDRVRKAAGGAWSLCNDDKKCKIQLKAILLTRVNIAAQCVGIGMQAANYKLRTSIDEIDGKKIDPAQREVDEKAIADAMATCDREEKEIGEKVVKALKDFSFMK